VIGWLFFGSGVVTFGSGLIHGKAPDTTAYSFPSVALAIGLANAYTYRTLRPRLEAEWKEWEASSPAPATSAPLPRP